MKSTRKKYTINGEIHLECKDCKEIKPKNNFYISSDYKEPRTTCKQCECERGRKRYQYTKEKLILEREAKKLRFEQLARDIGVAKIYAPQLRRVE